MPLHECIGKRTAYRREFDLMIYAIALLTAAVLISVSFVLPFSGVCKCRLRYSPAISQLRTKEGP
jgi:hypothetical protein